jgi:hypothetical protein
MRHLLHDMRHLLHNLRHDLTRMRERLRGLCPVRYLRHCLPLIIITSHDWLILVDC